MQEQGKYKIGEYTFQTFHEYRDGQEDVRKIECINKELNIQDPEVAVRLYNDIRSGKIVFKSPIGDQFFAHLADIVADKSVDLLEDKAVVEEAEGKVKYQKILGVAFIIFICHLCPFHNITVDFSCSLFYFYFIKKWVFYWVGFIPDKACSFLFLFLKHRTDTFSQKRHV